MLQLINCIVAKCDEFEVGLNEESIRKSDRIGVNAAYKNPRNTVIMGVVI